VWPPLEREYMFIKHSDGKILNVVDSDDLTETQKRAVKEVSEQIVKQSDESDTSKVKKSGR
jgi:hypothetical protein